MLGVVVAEPLLTVCSFVCLRCQLLERVHAASNGRNPMRGLMAQWRGVDGAQWRGLEAPDEQQVLALEVRQEWGNVALGRLQHSHASLACAC